MLKETIYLLMTTPMVLATLDDRKLQTRRRFKPQPTFKPTGISWRGLERATAEQFTAHALANCPYGQAGTMARVKENSWIWCHKQRDGDTATGRPKWRYIPVGRHVVYSADHPTKPSHRIDENPEHGWRLKVGRFMPGWAVRIELEVTEIRVQRIQACSAADAVAEGLLQLPHDNFNWHWDAAAATGFKAPWKAYKELWTKINGGESWVENEFIWVISFKRVKGAS